VALHAERSHDAVQGFLRRRPSRPVVVVLTGTDLYRPGGLSPASLATLEAARRIVVLHELAAADVPAALRERVVPILQSVPPLAHPPRPARGRFDICVIGHLREVKDPLRAAAASRLLPAASRIRIRQVGGAMNDEMAHRAAAEAAENPRFRWERDVPRWRARRMLAQSRAMVISSLSEGGAHVVSEAVVAGVPVLASRIPGNLGLLGEDYAGTFPAGDTAALADLMWRFERDAA
jgi:putative glycosyltransferase (TIGR04348 family)